MLGRVWLFAVLIATGAIAQRPEPAAGVNELRRLVAEAKERVARLESQWHARQPGVKKIADRAKALRELDDQITAGRYRVRNYINLEKGFDADIANKYERLQLEWRDKAAADLAADPVSEDVMKFGMTWDATRMKADAESLKRLKPELKDKDLSTPDAYWAAARPAMIERGEQAVKDFDAAAKASGLPDWAAEQAKRQTEVNAAETLEAYVRAKTPRELEEAREELQKLEARLSQAEFERKQRGDR